VKKVNIMLTMENDKEGREEGRKDVQTDEMYKEKKGDSANLRSLVSSIAVTKYLRKTAQRMDGLFWLSFSIWSVGSIAFGHVERKSTVKESSSSKAGWEAKTEMGRTRVPITPSRVHF
jgi:hypothetical protein